jgi:hypothetical protein
VRPRPLRGAFRPVDIQRRSLRLGEPGAVGARVYRRLAVSRPAAACAARSIDAVAALRRL